MKNGFTLAEVLITLGIIGIVAAMTIPTITANIQDKSLEASYKKAMSSIVNGYKLLMSKESVYNISNLPIMNCGSTASCFVSWHKVAFKLVDDNTGSLNPNSMPKDYTIQSKDTPSSFSWNNIPYIYRTADGISYGVEIDEGEQTFSIYTDINGNKKPNTVCKDLFKFRLSGTGKIADVCEELAGSGVCSLDSPQNCDYEACMALDQSEFPAKGFQCGWNSNGHCISVTCHTTNNHTTRDFCETDGFCK